MAYIVLPIPTSGDTIPPNKNDTPPKTADAHPAFSLSDSIASDDVEGVILPNPNN